MAHCVRLPRPVLVALLSWLLAGARPDAVCGQPIGADGAGLVRGQVVDAQTGQALARIKVEIVATMPTSRDTDVAGARTPGVGPGGTSHAPTPRGRGTTTKATDPTTPAATTPAATTPAATTADATRRTMTVVTDANGRFEIAAAPGPVTITVSVVGYVLARRDVRLAADRAVDVTIPLTEGTGSYTEEVRVTGDRFPRTESGVPTEQTLGSADLQNLKSTLADDPLRAVQTLPGVASTDDFKSEFTVRGSDFRHVGVTLDGVPSPLLLHTVHGVTDSGSLAMINSDILDSVTLLSGSYPQRYGNRTGATVEFRTREGSRDRPHVRIAASAINVSGVAEGPVGRSRRGSWLITARKSYLDWLVKRIDPDVTGTFGFVDAHGKLAYDLSPAHTVHASVVVGRSRFNEREEERSLNSLDVGLNRAVLINTSLRSTLRPTLVVTQRLYGVAGRFRNLNPLGLEIARGDDRDLSYRVELTSSIRSNLLIETGAHLQWLRGQGFERTFDEIGRFLERPFDGSASRQSMFAHVRWQPQPYLTLSPGARIDRWGLTDETLASPWLQAELGLPRSFLLAAGTGLYQQAPDLDQVLGPRGSPAAHTERAWHGDVGIGQRVGAWRWQAIAFVRQEHDVLRLPGEEPRIVDGRFEGESFATVWENALRGTSHGVELFLQRRTTNGLSGWIGYGYAATDYRDPIRNERFIADVDQRHTLNVYGSYRLSDRTNISGRFRIGSNVPLVGYFQQVDDRFFLASVRNTVRLPVYSRLDLRAARTYAISGGRLTLFVEAMNLYDRRNVRARFPRINPRRLEVFNVTESMFPILPSAGVMIEF